MTTKKRKKQCLTCNLEFTEKPAESGRQWESREFCSKACSNRSGRKTVNIFERLEEKQIKRSGCWGWIGSRDGRGYGTLSNRRGGGFSPEKAHRVSYENRYGEIPKGLNICHKCDNPECTNPDHLFAGTQKDNMRDCSNKERLGKKSLLNLNHEKSLTSEQVKEIQKIKFVAKNGRGEGFTVDEVAKQYGVCRDLITDVKYNRYEV